MTAAGMNYWPDAKCARAFWGQHDLPSYRRLLADTVDWASPGAGEHWLDLGCGGGALTRAIWERTGGAVAAVVGVDCAAANHKAYERFATDLDPQPGPRVAFLCHDFSSGLGPFADDSFDHAISGLSISYAESYDAIAGVWNTIAYDRLLAEVHRVLRAGGRFVFSVNVPNPSWAAVALASLPAVFGMRRPLRHMKRCLRMARYGQWLKREARTGRFHYLPAADIARRLAKVGFVSIEHRLSYSRQAYVFRAIKPGL